MKQILIKNAVFLFLAVLVGWAGSAGAQEFKGFYGNGYTPVSSLQGHHLRKAARRQAYAVQNNGFFNYGSNSAYSIPFHGFYGNTNPPGCIVINILPAGTSPYDRTSDYNYYNGTDYRRNNLRNTQFDNWRRDDGYRQVPDNARSIKIGGNRFYEMNGNYYRADYFDDWGRMNTATNARSRNNYFSQEDGAVRGDNIYFPARLRSDNADYTNVARPTTKTVYVDDNGNTSYVNRRQADNSLTMSQQDQQAMRDENAQLKRQLQQKEANDKAAMKAEADMYSNLKEGDTVDRIPNNSKEVTIDGKKTYLSPGNTFYRKENGKFTVVGKQ